MVKEIVLTNGMITLVDDEDYDKLSGHLWGARKDHGTTYALYYGHGAFNSLSKMHRIIMNTPPHLQVDHIDGNGLNNQKSNLRNVTNYENHRNLKPKSSRYTGVSWCKRDKKWRSYIRIKGKSIALGSFESEEEAHGKYTSAVSELLLKESLLFFFESMYYDDKS